MADIDGSYLPSLVEDADAFHGTSGFNAEDYGLSYSEGYDDGYSDGYASGYATGYAQGLLDAGPTYRMRARDTSLAAIVFWESTTIDSAGTNYAGPGPLADIIVQNIVPG